MKVKDIYFKTMKFVWMKFALGAATVGLSVIWFAVLFGITMLFQNSAAIIVAVILWFAGTGAINSIINHYFGYLVKAGHVAIITTAVTTGQIPENQFSVAKDMVKERFVTSNVYFVVDKLVSSSVKQLQNGLDKVDSLLGNIPGISTFISILQLFVSIALNYVDECCLGYTFLKKNDSAFKSAADGVVIYFQNGKSLLKNAAKTTAIVIVATFLAWLLPFIVIGALFKMLAWSSWIAFFLSGMIALVIKSAFVDSYMMVDMMVSYMRVAPSTQITFDLYGKLCRLSNKFKELFGKAEAEGPINAGPTVQQPVYAEQRYQGQPTYQQQPQYQRQPMYQQQQHQGQPMYQQQQPQYQRQPMYQQQQYQRQPIYQQQQYQGQPMYQQQQYQRQPMYQQQQQYQNNWK